MPFTTVKKKKIPGERRIRRRCGRKGSHCCCHGQRKIAEFMVDLRIRLAVEREGKRRADHFLLEKSMLHDLAYPQPQFVQKKERVANKLRLEGNEKLLKCGASTVEEVLMLFTESLAYAPVGHECVALAYANRAIALHKGGYYLAAIADNQRALNAGYPEHLRYKIYARQGKIYRAMEQNGRALKCYNLALGYLEKSRLDAGDRLKLQETDIDPALDELLGAEEEEEDFVDLTHDPSIGVEEIEVPSFGDKFNPEVPALSASVSLKYSETFGRHLVANRPIQAGEILIIEKPFAAILFEEFQYCNCSHCFKHCVALLPCPNCNWAMFCSEQCRGEAEAYHSVECSVMPAAREMNVGFFELPLRMITYSGVQNLKEYFRSEMEDWDTEVTEELGSTSDPSETYEESRTAGFNEDGQYISSNPNTITNLRYLKFPASHSYRHHIFRYDLLDSVANVIKLLKLEKSDWAWKLHEFVVRFFESLPCNGSNSIHQFVMGMNNLEHLGTSVYPTFCLLNHSCCANVFYHYYGTTLVVRACRSIAEGEQIYQASGKYFLKYDKQTREKNLQQSYMLTCKCKACLEDWPLFHNLNSLPYFNVHNKELLLSHTMLSRNCKFDDDSSYIITDENFEMFKTHLGLLEKYKQTMNQQYFFIQECFRWYFCKKSNRVKDLNPRLPKVKDPSVFAAPRKMK